MSKIDMDLGGWRDDETGWEGSWEMRHGASRGCEQGKEGRSNIGRGAGC